MSLNRLLGTQLHHTIAYHPESNSLIERFHRTLKAACMSHYNSSTWYLQLPWVLLGLRTTPKEGLHLSAAEMIPGEFFPDNDTSPDIIGLQTIVAKLAPCLPSYRPNKKTFILKDLHMATHIFIRTDAVCPPLTQTYTVPYWVLNRKQKAFLVDV
ncbi:uncharacterized protein LOC135216494 [Macrobrachium nipponense]|uniref:uncharacterized protein LOC135216494 n=1 Tax=Macrobrachium nipponense TaxID=159736 RepID=UPI0030C88323